MYFMCTLLIVVHNIAFLLCLRKWYSVFEVLYETIKFKKMQLHVLNVHLKHYPINIIRVYNFVKIN